MLFVTGARTTIVKELRQLLPPDEEVVSGNGDLASVNHLKLMRGVPIKAERYLFAQGLLRPQRYLDQTEAEIVEGMAVNLLSVVKMAEWVLSQNNRARICVIGSESGYRGSFDGAYAIAKAGLHKWVETREVGPEQQLVGIAPGMIADSGMTERRQDQDRVQERAKAHPRGRLLTALEVAKLARFVLYEDHGYLCNTVIRMDGRTA